MQVPQAEAGRLFEALSAWMDGEALPAGVDEAALLHWLLHDEQAQTTWRCWQQWQAHAGCQQGWAVDEVALQTGAVGRQHRPRSAISRVAVVGSAAWSERLSQRLACTRVGCDDEPVAATPLVAPMPSAGSAAEPPVAPTVAPTVAAEAATGAQGIGTAAPATPATRPPAEAANDPVWRWKLAAGFASVAAVGMALWNLLGQPAAPNMNVPGANGPLLAVQTVQTPGAAATLLADAPDQRLARGPQSMAGQPQVVAATTAAVSADDPYAEALLQAHSQLGDNLLLQEVSLTEQDEAF